MKSLNAPIVEVLRRGRKEFQKRRFICAMFVCAAVVSAGYLYTYIDSLSVRRLSMVVFYLSVGIMVCQWSWFIIKNIMTAKIRVAKKTIAWIRMPEFDELAKDMKVKLHKKHPFGVTDGLDNAFTNPRTRQIVFGKDLFDRLEKLERLALAVHELTHLKENHLAKQFFIPWLALMLVLLTIPEKPYVISGPIYFAAFLMLFAFIGRKNEYAADNNSAARTSNEVTISLLRKSAPHEQWLYESEVHPSIDKRITRLSRK